MDNFQRSATLLVTTALAMQLYFVRAEWMEVRLRGNIPNEGRLEVKISDPTKTQHVRQWGTVCDDHWDLADSMVACRMLGFTAGGLLVHGALQRITDSSASALPHPALFSPILMDDVQCFGGELSLEQCMYDNTHDCEHHEDVYLRCFGSSNSNATTGASSTNNDLTLILVGIATQLTNLANQSASLLQELQGQKQQNSNKTDDNEIVRTEARSRQLSDELEALKRQQSFLWTVLFVLVLCFFVAFATISVFMIWARRNKGGRWSFGGNSSPYEVPILARHDSFGMVSRDVEADGTNATRS